MIQYKHLEGRRWIHGQQDCYALGRVYFKENHDLDFMDIARPDCWWEDGHDLIMGHFRDLGFRLVDIDHPDQLQLSDVFAMAVNHTTVNHLGMYVGNGYFLHHYRNRLSKADLYKGIWKHHTCAVLRHPAVVINPSDLPSVNLIDLLPTHMKERYEPVLRQLAEKSS